MKKDVLIGRYKFDRNGFVMFKFGPRWSWSNFKTVESLRKYLLAQDLKHGTNHFIYRFLKAKEHNIIIKRGTKRIWKIQGKSIL